MRRFFSALMLGMFAVGFCVGCGGDDAADGDTKTPTTEEAETKSE